ncbi:iron-sulfur cluster assembly scaffold protein [Candidatus Dojkabacteria bacterium]|nr:iron-sulfur cluster assembly scaffold protein [Candidatus Dojkabacteria bacterium]
MNQIYKELILDHYKSPQNAGSLDNPTHEATEENTSCGDSIKVQLIMKDGRIKKIKHITEGCAISVAAASLLSEILVGKSIISIGKLDEQDIIKILGVQLTASRINCALLPLRAVRKALKLKTEN